MGQFLDFSLKNSKKENISTFIVEGIKSKVQNDKRKSLLMKGAMLHETPTTQANILDD
jgi:hypothetical protein